ncbi:LamG domain-containing protein [bacterium]|nr:LamG domain-containing protein [bacterium]
MKINLFCITIIVLLWLFVSMAGAGNSAVEFFSTPGDTVKAPDSDSLDIDGKEFTMEAWVFAPGTQTGNGNEGIIINKEDSYEMALRGGDDRLMFAIQAGAWDWFGGGKPTMNEWHHLAVTYDGKISQGWIDGKAAPDPTNANTLAITPQDGDASPFQIGHRVCCGGVPFLGIIDEVRISDVVRYTKDFPLPKAEFTSDRNTRLLWHLNEGTGKEVFDASGNKNTGEFEGGPKWVEGAPISPSAVQKNGKLTTMWSQIKTRPF